MRCPQADAERSLERLHEAAEVQLKKVMENNSTAKDNAAPVDIESFMVSFYTALGAWTEVATISASAEPCCTGLEGFTRPIPSRQCFPTKLTAT